MDSLRLRETFCLRCPVCRRSPRLRGSPASAGRKAASRPFLRLHENSVVDTARGKARRGPPVQRRRSGCRKVPRTPHAVLIPATSGAGPGSASPSASRAKTPVRGSRLPLYPWACPAKRPPRQSPAAYDSPARERSLPPPDFSAREAERRPFPAQNRALSLRQVPPARASPRGTQQRCRNDMLPMFATMSASTAKTESSRQASARPLSFARQVPDRIKLSAQSIFLKDHFFII